MQFNINGLNLNNVNGLIMNDEEYEDNYNELIDTSNIKKIKLSEKLKLLGDSNSNSNPYLNIKSNNLLVIKIMYLTNSQTKFKLLQNSQMYMVENLLPESKISFLEELSYNGIYGVNRTYHVYLPYLNEFITNIIFEIELDSKYNFDTSNFKYSDIFEQLDLMINNIIVESIDSKLIEFILSKYNIKWTYYNNKLILPIPFSLLSNQNGIFLNKIKHNNNPVKIIIKISSGELVKNISSISYIGKYYNYSGIEKLPLKKMPIQYNMDLIKYLSTEPIISNCEVTSLNSIFSNNYWTFQHNQTELFNQMNPNRYILKFDNYIRGICFIIYDIETKEKVTLDIFESVLFQINGHDYSGYNITSSMLKYNMINFKDFVIPEGYGYIDFDNFLNFEQIDNFAFIFGKNKNLSEKFLGRKFNIDIWGCGANTLLYLEGNVIKVN